MNIGLFTSVFFNNIGNGFIDLGAEVTINDAKPDDSHLVKVSQCANFAASMGNYFMLKENPAVNWIWVNLMQKFSSKVQDRTYKAIDTLDVFSVPYMFDFDYFIIPGCVLTVPFFTIYEKLLEEKSKRGCKLIFLGASGNFYNDYEINSVKQSLNKLKPYAIMTRDTNAYENYKDCCKHAYNGIDNVFFVNRLSIPVLDTKEKPYVVVNIEEPKNKDKKEKLIENLRDQNIIFSNHKPFPYTKISKLVKTNKMMISDYPMDYLVLYKNATRVYSDRVHACIPTISFGNEAMLFSDSPRISLFKNVGIKKASEDILAINDLRRMQENQIAFLKNILK